MDLLSMLKMANIFSPTGQTTPQNFPVGSIGGPQVDTPPVDASQAPPDLNTTLQGLLNPKDDQFNNYAQMIQSMPKESQYPPSNFRKIAGAIAGMGAGGPVGIANGQVVGYKSNIPEGMAIQKNITDEPYHKALEQWAMQLEPQGKIAQMEANRNTNLRQIGLGEQSRQIQQQKADETARKDREAHDIAQQRANIAKQRADIVDYKVKNPNMIIKEDSNGYLISIDPSPGGGSSQILDTDGNPIKSSVMTDSEKLQQQEKNRQADIKARGQNALSLEGKRAADRAELEGKQSIDKIELARTNIQGRKDVQAARTLTTGAAKPMLPTQQKQDTINKALNVISKDPTLKPYVKFEKTNSGTVTGVSIPPVGDKYFAGIRGYNETDRMRAYNAIFGQAPVPGVSQQSAPQRKLIPGTNKYAVSTDGGKTWKAE